ncbi:MAG: hypothetical protein ACXVXL_19305, partial [Solirubrobacteraceae bacterium]
WRLRLRQLAPRVENLAGALDRVPQARSVRSGRSPICTRERRLGPAGRARTRAGTVRWLRSRRKSSMRACARAAVM